MSSTVFDRTPVPEGKVTIPEGSYGVPNRMLYGLQSAKEKIAPAHPLESTEKMHREPANHIDLNMLRRTQGMHAPLRLQMEIRAASKIRRLPCISSSNLMLDTVLARDDVITWDDVLNNPADAEMMLDPYLMMEKKLGIL
ncbi:PREDICTED: proteasome maturation protein-like isoform X2 [Priapulus caudatus]|uniref:Proteasome maturation protein-like isoform X2 n=1 Tax=Priapulus caudatus TaxID=37621 RepID=A0ABM1F7D9_PRICU|nr:PREDICTED: proteasome maturation protein-like isoform X2 [Priapulus caudatus]